MKFNNDNALIQNLYDCVCVHSVYFGEYQLYQYQKSTR